MLDVMPVTDGIDARVAEYTARRTAMQDADRYFYLQATTGKTNHRVTMADGRDMVMLASYSYLGLIGHPRIEAAAHEAIDRYGTGAGGVRLLTGTTDLARAARGADRVVREAPGCVRLLERLRHQHRDHLGADRSP